MKIKKTPSGVTLEIGEGCEIRISPQEIFRNYGMTVEEFANHLQGEEGEPQDDDDDENGLA
jgi:hypothetical protein